MGDFSEWSAKSLKVTMRIKRWPAPPEAQVYDLGEKQSPLMMVAGEAVSSGKSQVSRARR